MQFQQVVGPDVLDRSVGLVGEQDADGGSGVGLVLQPEQLCIVAAGCENRVGGPDQAGDEGGADDV